MAHPLSKDRLQSDHVRFNEMQQLPTDSVAAQRACLWLLQGCKAPFHGACKACAPVSSLHLHMSHPKHVMKGCLSTLCLSFSSSFGNPCVAEADAEERAKALNMMRMLANRQNSRWLEAKEWDMPYTFDATKFPTLLGTTTLGLPCCINCCLPCSCCLPSGADRATGPCSGLHRSLSGTCAVLHCVALCCAVSYVTCFTVQYTVLTMRDQPPDSLKQAGRVMKSKQRKGCS